MDEQTQDFFEGTWHALCAIVSALEQRDPGMTAAVVNALTAKIEWMAAHNTPLSKATPALELREWIIDPPRNPADPYGSPPSDQPPHLPTPEPYRGARVLPFPTRRRP